MCVCVCVCVCSIVTTALSPSKTIFSTDVHDLTFQGHKKAKRNF